MSPWSRLRLVRATLVVALAAVLATCSPALADRAFAPRFSTNANGDITIIGNTLETCQSTAANCSGARAGTGSALNNNSFVMQRVDIDPTMVDSSAARLDLPTGARVLFAGLYYGARTSAGTGGKTAPNATAEALRTVDFKAPGAATFERLSGVSDESTEVKGAYGVFVDVTAQVRRGGPGNYTVANVQAGTGEDRYAGWALVVAYESAGDPPRNLSVFDGLQSVTQGKPALTIPVSGFQTPLSGPVRTRLGFVAYEGDLGISGDSANLDGKTLTDAVTPANNFFNSAISIDGRHRSDKNPDYVNQLGFDAKLIGIDGVLANGATRANIGLKTSSDQYLPQVVTFATELYAPVIRATKTVANLTHPDAPGRSGDVLRYTVTYVNDGLEAARNFVGEDLLPAGTTYAPGSLRIGGAPAPTDLPGDDLGEYDPASRSVRFFLGAGAGPGAGGTLAASGQPGSTAQVSFEARVDENVTEEHDVTDVASATFLAPSLNEQLSALSSPATIKVLPNPAPPPEADLATVANETVAPSSAGTDTVDDHTLIIDHGPANATDVVIHDTEPAGSVIESVSTDEGSCSVSGNEVTCRVPELDAGGAVNLDVVADEPAGDAAGGSMSDATASAAQFDPVPANNADATSAPAPTSSSATSLAVDIHEASTTVPLGKLETEEIAITNNGPGTATGVDITSALDAAAEVIAVNPGLASCVSLAPLECRITSLSDGSSDTIDVEVRPLERGPLIDGVSVSDEDANTQLNTDFVKASAVVTSRPTAARLRIVPVRPLVTARQLVEFVVIAGVTRPVPGVAPQICVALPPGLRVTSARGASISGSRVCWRLTDLISGRSQSFRFAARVSAVPRSGATFSVRGRLAGANFKATRASALVQAPPLAVACPAGVRGRPRGRVAC